MRNILILIVFTFSLCLTVGCSMQAGDAEEPEEFSTELKPAKPITEPVAEPIAKPMAKSMAEPSNNTTDSTESLEAPATVETVRIADVEQGLAQALERMDKLELALSSLQQNILLIEQTASQALTLAQHSPFAQNMQGLGQQEAEKESIKQSLQKIMTLSNELLGRIEGKARSVPASKPAKKTE